MTIKLSTQKTLFDSFNFEVRCTVFTLFMTSYVQAAARHLQIRLIITHIKMEFYTKEKPTFD